MSLLTPEPGLVFWMLLSFGIVAFILVKYGFPVILKMVDQRKDYIDNSLLAALQANEELARVKETSETILAETRREQAEMLNDASKLREELIEKAREDARLESEKIIVSAREQIRVEKEEALRSVREEITSLSVDIAEKILRKKLGSEKEQMSMIDRLLDEINISKS